MKKKYLYSLLIPYMLSVSALTSCEKPHATATNVPTQLPTYNKNTYVCKNVPKVRIDTLNVSNENYKEITTKGAAGVFFYGSNTVVVYHFNATTDSSYIVNYCNYSNSMRPLYMRHELEHARKQDLTHNTDRFSPISRAEVAAVNEIMAPASEIIEAVDYHARTGKPFPNAKPFIAQADSVITSAMGGFLPLFVNYNYQPIADAVITYATENFVSSVNRGYYKHTIRKKYNQKPSKKQKFVDFTILLTFNPDHSKWEPIWEFESRAGACNPYKHASWAVRQKLMQTVDSVVCSVTNTDKNALFFKYSFSR